MPSTAEAQIVAIYRYPVKGLSPQPLDSADMKTGETLPFDRAWAIENGPGRFNSAAPKHLPKINFLMLMRDEKLATLHTEFDEETKTLTICRDGKQVACGVLTAKIGRQMIEQFFAAYMKDALRGAPKIVSSPGHSMSDVAAKCVHIINLESLRELERAAGRSIDPLRFRPNIVIDGLPAWAEFDLVGKDFRAGPVQLKGFARTQRCAATEVDPTTASRDIAIPAILKRTWSHADFGIYATVESDGVIAVNDPLNQ